MKSKGYDSMKFGILIGIIGPIIGFLLYGAYWSWQFNRTFGYFVNDVFLGTPVYRSSIIALSLLFNLIPFFFFLRSDRYKSARGVLASVFIYVPFAVYYRFA